MIYLTVQHTRPPSHIIAGGKRIPLAPLIAREDTARLAQYGIYPHHPLEPGIPYPLGKEWVELDGEWFEETIGTPEEIQAALDAQAAAAREAYLDSLECTRLQARLELIDRDLWDSVQAWVGSQSAATKAYFDDAQTWRYRDERLQAGATDLGLSDAQLIAILEAARLR
ncbi:MAG: hypothetical protein EOM24_18495 [Chloroflexia bacterium]|nr:hypothetical protein [Chloroflexia bacterium]